MLTEIMGNPNSFGSVIVRTFMDFLRALDLQGFAVEPQIRGRRIRLIVSWNGYHAIVPFFCATSMSSDALVAHLQDKALLVVEALYKEAL